MISQRNTLGAKRQVFMVSLGGFDTHDDQIPHQPNLHTQLGNAIKYFYDSMKTLGVQFGHPFTGIRLRPHAIEQWRWLRPRLGFASFCRGGLGAGPALLRQLPGDGD